MEDAQIKLSALWIAIMLTYLLGDVLRIFSGDFKAGKIGGMQITQKTWLGIAIIMVIPVVMVFLSLTLNYPVMRGHGSFATGQTLDEAFHWSSTLEESCQIELAVKIINEPFIEYRKMSESYSKF